MQNNEHELKIQILKQDNYREIDQLNLQIQKLISQKNNEISLLQNQKEKEWWRIREELIVEFDMLKVSHQKEINLLERRIQKLLIHNNSSTWDDLNSQNSFTNRFHNLEAIPSENESEFSESIPETKEEIASEIETELKIKLNNLIEENSKLKEELEHVNNNVIKTFEQVVLFYYILKF